MKTFATPEPDSNPAAERAIRLSRAQLGRMLLTREARLDLAAAFAVLAAAFAMAILFDPGRALDMPLALGLVLAYAAASRVEFRVGSGVAVPSQVVFVPMLFLLPTPAVPLFVIIALLVARIPEYVSGEVHASRWVLRVAEAWYAIAPALVLTVAGATSPDWADWPVYAAALLSQFGFDFAFTLVREQARIGVGARALLEEFRTIWLVDAALSPVGLLVAFAAVGTPWAFVLVLPLIGLVAFFAHEREARIDHALALSSAYRGTAHLLGDLLSANDEYTGSHSRSVVLLAHQVGAEMDLDDVTLRDIEFGALLHDVGKMSVPNEVINKPGPLTDTEWDLMRQHTVEGEQMLERIGGVLGEIGAVVRAHHERFDGNGYPDRLRGAEIPIASRVIAACDAFNAMTSERPYRSPVEYAEAIGELRAMAGTQFDPDVVSAVITVVGRWTESEGGRSDAEHPVQLAAP